MMQMHRGFEEFNGGGMHPMMFLGHGLMMLLFWGLIIGIIIYVARKWSANEKSKQSNSAIEILRQRYAKGEIDTDDYKERLAELMKTADLPKTKNQ
jgi:putative membrane protein